MRSSSAVVFLAAVTSVAACHGFPAAAKRVAQEKYPAVKALGLKLYASCRDKKLVPEQSPVAGTDFAKSSGVLEVQVVCPKLVVGMPAVTLPPIHSDKWKPITRTSRNHDLGKPDNPEFARRYARVPSLLVPQKNSVDVCLDGKALPGEEPFTICVAYATKK
jgi:hypothetical protein